ncbi:Uncharacterised protein [Clostridioides difficile]|nr:Uncharacterised protein [Clostridioides difficile]
MNPPIRALTATATRSRRVTRYAPPPQSASPKPVGEPPWQQVRRECRSTRRSPRMPRQLPPHKPIHSRCSCLIRSCVCAKCDHTTGRKSSPTPTPRAVTNTQTPDEISRQRLRRRTSGWRHRRRDAATSLPRRSRPRRRSRANRTPRPTTSSRDHRRVHPLAAPG